MTTIQQQHEQVRHRLTELEQYESPKRKLEEADRLISQEREAAHKAEEAARSYARVWRLTTRKAKS